MSDQKPIRILYIEDDRELANLVEKQLRRKGFSIDIAYDGEEGLAKYFSGSYDVLLLDQVLPVYNGLEVIRILDSRGPLPPTVMITGMGNESLAVEAMKMGATDYIVKDAGCGFLKLFPAVIEQAIFTNRLAEQKMRAVEKLRTSEKKYRTLFELAGDTFLVALPPDDTIIDSNKAATKMLGYSKEEMTGHGFRAMASTVLHEQGWPSDVIERQLAHAERNSIKAAYNHAQHLSDRRRMMQVWADYLDTLKAGELIIPLRRTIHVQ